MFLSCEPGFVLRIIEYAILTHVRVISMTTCESHVKRCPTFPGERQEVQTFCMRHQLRALLQSCLCDIIAFRMICQNNYVLRLHRIMAVLFCTPSPMHRSSRYLRAYHSWCWLHCNAKDPSNDVWSLWVLCFALFISVCVALCLNPNIMYGALINGNVACKTKTRAPKKQLRGLLLTALWQHVCTVEG